MTDKRICYKTLITDG